MKTIFNIALSASLLLAGFTACEDELDVVNPNQQTTLTFGANQSELDEVVLACYNRIRIEGTFGRVGYLYEVVAGDEVNSYSDNDWWRPYDYFSSISPSDGPDWPFRDWYYTINTCNQCLYYLGNSSLDPNSEAYAKIKGQALFIRGLAYYELATYYQDVPLITTYEVSSLNDLYVATTPQAEVLDQVEADFAEAMTLLPKRDEGGEWAKGRATCGAAAGYYARALMFRHKFSQALPVLKDIIAGKYGTYKLLADYGDNFRSTVENQEESLFEVQFLDWGIGGTVMEWTPVNNDKASSQGQALETVFSGGDYGGGWNDLGSTPWLYQTFKSQKTTAGTVDPRLYWTLISYEEDYNNMSGFENKAYTLDVAQHVTTGAHKGISVCKHTTARENLYQVVAAAGLSCGVNIRLMRYSDVLLRAAECENEVNGPTQQAIDWINQVRSRAGLANLKLADFNTADKLFEQIANVERPTEFGCEHGRFQDIIRWGWLYDADRLLQLRKHACTYWIDNAITAKYNELVANYCKENEVETITNKEDIAQLQELANNYGKSLIGELPSDILEAQDDPFSHWIAGHEYLPIRESNLDANPNLKGNSANKSTSNSAFYEGYNIHPVVAGIGVQ
ncbi:MAG: RagB/SusD family nutrient uptake outer membrane protein [Bacteroidales bacterium]|nr:RagB/SusD family nutrient uptake outer membrane protein [Bacteroidales bacterium]